MRPVLALAILLTWSVAANGETTTWELRGDRWIQVNRPTTTTAPTDEPMLDIAQRLIVAGNGKAGAKTAIEWLLRKSKDAPGRDRALMLVAEGYFLDGKRVDSFFYLDELMDEHPESPLYQRALQLQYDIADAFLNGYKRVFLYWATLDATDEGVDMLYRIQQRSPGSLLAEKALLRTADFYYTNSDYDFAADAYSAYMKSYPRSPLIPQVRLRRAYATLAQFRGARYDATPLIDARAQLVELTSAYPDIAQDEGLVDLVRRVDDTFAQKIYRQADFYRRTNEPAAAIYNYRFLIATFPNTPEARKAVQWLKTFSPQLLAAKAPRRSSGYTPPTQADLEAH